MLTATRTDALAAILSAPFTLFVLALIVAAPLVCAWLDRRPARNPFAPSPATRAAREQLRRQAAEAARLRGEGRG